MCLLGVDSRRWTTRKEDSYCSEKQVDSMKMAEDLLLTTELSGSLPTERFLSLTDADFLRFEMVKLKELVASGTICFRSQMA
ncbi:hypothetical protein CEXT_440651 [Caerostris extrusa]|uniref:Uncharacterized protein n=1 Tax=Caerostris extrusa TaxID=172846 RepID=A0AAV4RH08_CAEEX|nr:hypothetical protein CEXT_440651 [Caerostris extrusa]